MSGHESLIDSLCPEEELCFELLWRERFAPDGEHATCPKCDKTRTFKRYATAQQRQSWTCTACGHHIHPTAGTIFHKSATPLHAWFYVIDMVRGNPKPNAKEIERRIGCNYKTARRMIAQVRVYLDDSADLPWWPSYCACGCGELLNPQVLRIRALARRGLSPWFIGLALGEAPGYVRRTLRKPPRTAGTKHWWATDAGATFRQRRKEVQNPRNALQAAQAAERRAKRDAERERRRAARAAKWWSERPERKLPRSLDAPIDGSGGDSFYAIKEAGLDDGLDPAVILEREQDASRLLAIVGDMSPDDVARLSEWDLRRLRERLVAEGITPRGVTAAERERLLTPNRHSGAGITRARGHSQRSRAEKVAHKAANKARGNSNRPAQKPPKRWERAA